MTKKQRLIQLSMYVGAVVLILPVIDVAGIWAVVAYAAGILATLAHFFEEIFS